jgi:hypothetical protein
VADLTALRERAFEFVEEARSLDLKLDLTAARAAMGRALDRVLDALADQATAERMATTVALIQRARWLGLGFGGWRTQHRFFALWRAHPESRETLRSLGDGRDIALVAKSAR